MWLRKRLLICGLTATDCCYLWSESDRLLCSCSERSLGLRTRTLPQLVVEVSSNSAHPSLSSLPLPAQWVMSGPEKSCEFDWDFVAHESLHRIRCNSFVDLNYATDNCTVTQQQHSATRQQHIQPHAASNSQYSNHACIMPASDSHPQCRVTNNWGVNSLLIAAQCLLSLDSVLG